MPQATIIIPTYNEAGNIEATLNALKAEFNNVPKQWTMSILVVDDSSPDGTGEIVASYGKKNAFTHLLTNKKKAGLGSAYLKGMEHAFGAMKSDVVFEFDADLSHDPKKIHSFLEKIDEGYDLVLGSRYIPGGSIPNDWGWNRKFLSVVGNLFIMLVLTDFRIRDWTTGYRAIRRNVYEKIQHEMHSDRFSGYTFQIGFLHKTVRQGFKVAEVPIDFVDRVHGHSKLGAEYIKNTLLYIMKVRIKEILQHRLFKFVVVGGFGAVVQLGSLSLFRNFFPYQLAYFFSVEMAVISNFIWSNLWTFSDRKLSVPQLPGKFIQFNIASAGSIIIQQVLAFVGENTIGFVDLFTLPIIGFTVDTGLTYAVLGILLGMFWNFFAYSRIIWKRGKN